MKNDKDALLLDIQRMSTEDGPGLRTTVFFKGCSLSCAWCHNPESILVKREVQWLENRCIGCRSCVKVCRNSALHGEETGIKIDRKRCKSCLSCVAVCPANALEAKGETWSIEKLVYEVLKDRVYFQKSGGGVTASGGEALLQMEFVAEFFERLKAEGIHTALDTAGCVPVEYIERVLPYTDLLLYDIKLMDSAAHRKFTGRGNEEVLRNLLYSAEFIRKNKQPILWIRTPVIPGATAYPENIEAIGRFISENLADVIERWDLCAFNNLCRDKYRRLDRDWQFKDTPLMKKSEMEMLAEAARKSGVKEGIVHWSGATALDE